MLRAVFAPFGTTDDLATALHHTREDVAELLRVGEQICDEYTHGTAPLQEYMLARSLLHDFLFAYGELVDDWAQRSLDRVAAWEHETPEQQAAAAIQIYRTRTRRERPPLPLPPLRDFQGHPVTASDADRR